MHTKTTIDLAKQKSAEGKSGKKIAEEHNWSKARVHYMINNKHTVGSKVHAHL